MRLGRWLWACFSGGALGALGGCQLISGLNGLHEGAGGSGGNSTSSSSSSSGAGGGQHQHDCGFNHRDCGGGQCGSNGICEPYALATGVSVRTNIISDNTWVFWGGDGPADSGVEAALFAFDIQQGDTKLYPTGTVAKEIAGAGSHVYWIDAVEVARVGKPLDPVTPKEVLFACSGGQALRVSNSSEVVWADSNGVWLGHAEGADAGSPALLPLKSVMPFDIDDEAVFWFGAAPDAGNGLHRAVLAAPGSITSWESALEASRVVGGGDKVFWIGSAAGSGLRWHSKTLPGAVDSVVIPAGAEFGGLVVHDPWVYWVDSSNCAASGTVRAFNPGGNSTGVQELATTAGCPLLGQDADALYWYDQSSKTIMRLVKP